MINGLRRDGTAGSVPQDQYASNMTGEKYCQAGLETIRLESHVQYCNTFAGTFNMPTSYQ